MPKYVKDPSVPRFSLLTSSTWDMYARVDFKTLLTSISSDLEEFTCQLKNDQKNHL